VQPDPNNKLADTQEQPFLTKCDVVKTCTRNLSLIGDKCSAHVDCAIGLSCDPTGHCESTMGICGNGKLDDGEECDPTADASGVVHDDDCPDTCSSDCSCPIDHGDGDSCASRDDPTYGCYRLLECMSEVKFNSIEGTLLITKFTEGGICKLKISELK
jgi:hypothetical protein